MFSCYDHITKFHGSNNVVKILAFLLQAKTTKSNRSRYRRCLTAQQPLPH